MWVEEDEEDDEEETAEDEERRSLLKSLDSIQKILLETQEGCGIVASYFERVTNLFTHEEPFISGLVTCLLGITASILFVFGLRTVS